MKFNRFIPAILAIMSFAAISCQEEEQDLGLPDLTLARAEVEFPKESSEDTISFTATRAWTVSSDAEWIAVDPDHGMPSDKPCVVSVTVLDNSSYDREAKLNVSIGFTTIPVTIRQSGKGSVDQLVIYRNDFDRQEVSANSYLDKSDDWRNEAGSGMENVKYYSSGITARNNSKSNGSYSDYEGSGGNNLFFGADPTFAILDLTTNGARVFEFSFGTEKYDNNDKTALFDPAEFLFYVSIDGNKWASVPYTYAGTEAGRWNVAKGTFSVPENTATMHVMFKTAKASCYRIDDFKLVILEEGTADEPDFANGTAIAVTANITGKPGSGGGDTPALEDVIYTWNFKADKQGSFTLNEVNVPAGLSAVWTYDSKYGMKATSYYNSANNAAESWLISPVIDLSNETKACLEFQHAGNYFEDITADVHVMASKDNGVNWTELAIPEYPSDWTFVSSGKISLADYLGGTLKIAFKYTSNATKSGTWEIQSMSVLRQEGSTGGNGGQGGGDESDGKDETPTGTSIVIADLGTALTWSETTDDTHGKGYTATDAQNGLVVSYFKATSSTAPVAPADAFIKVYKNSILRISFTDGKPVKGVIITTSSATYTKNMTVGTLTIKADGPNKTIHWSGSKNVFEAIATEQVRIQKLEVFY
ncbi:MAG: BACON domain-containing protein [Bacteroidales bacterium]|nr:BACON domain-containing protein [Bacteroidales bacterium]